MHERKIILSADTPCDVGEELKSRYQVSLYPLHIILDGTQYTDGQDITSAQLYEAWWERKLLPRTAKEQSQVGDAIDRNELKPGDLVFFNTMRHAFSHVGIYLGDNHFVHAPRTGAEVRVENMNQSYWVKRYNGARRILENN